MPFSTFPPKIFNGVGHRRRRGRVCFTPSISRAAERPMITHGVQSGDVAANSAIVWVAPTARRAW